MNAVTRISRYSWDSALHIPRRRKIDWLMVFVWCVAMPFTAGWFWYAIYGLIKAAWGKL